ncbi:MAG: hybrid sensor histidine kinase/response regulator, partial [Caldimonas sp.]
LKLRTEALADQLRAEKIAADAARHEAEVANRAKTQFFTAASHDLRQPLHAMGLFAEALRNRTHEPDVARLVNSINESVDALEGLFSELLDITRIDSGGVEVLPASFAVGDIFRKLRLHFEPAAFEKGLELRFRGGAHVLLADPLLVERILRNLVSNAIRYTHDGSVLVSCRRRNGRMLLQVWDTGPGIGEAERTRIFEEFYQVPGSRDTASVEQKKGLGLGLAIVKRLAALMDAPVGLWSELGRGSIFSVEVPIGSSPRAAARPTAGKAPTGITLDGRLIVIVEDEAAVREGVEVLLQGWGATTLSFESVGAVRAWAESAAAGSLPSLIMADYRLQHAETGVEAIRAVRARYGAGVPAIVVTGSSMTGHDKEALEHDFHLLIKPVLPNKLRAMIAFKLGKSGA